MRGVRLWFGWSAAGSCVLQESSNFATLPPPICSSCFLILQHSTFLNLPTLFNLLLFFFSIWSHACWWLPHLCGPNRPMLAVGQALLTRTPLLSMNFSIVNVLIDTSQLTRILPQMLNALHMLKLGYLTCPIIKQVCWMIWRSWTLGLMVIVEDLRPKMKLI